MGFREDTSQEICCSGFETQGGIVAHQEPSFGVPLFTTRKEGPPYLHDVFVGPFRGPGCAGLHPLPNVWTERVRERRHVR